MYKPVGISKVYEILKKTKCIIDYYDPDFDGLISGYFIERLAVRLGIPYKYYINENREHGCKLPMSKIEELSKIKGLTLIVVDALMTRKEVEEIVKRGVNVINIDHHENDECDVIYVEHGDCSGIVINNQYLFEPKNYKFLSGAGVVYYVIKNLIPDLLEQYGDFEALVGVSLLSDIRELENKEAEFFLKETYSHESELTAYLTELAGGNVDFGFGVRILDRNFIDYTLSPKVNAMFRLNKGYEAIELIKGKFTEGAYLDIYRNIQKSVVEGILERLVRLDFSHLTYGYVENYESEYKLTNFIGLVASQIKNEGKTTMLFVKEGNQIIRGSVRGMCDDIDYREIFGKYGFICKGHKVAFGIRGDVDESSLGKINEDIAKLEAGYEERKYEGRIVEVSNLSFYLMNKGKNIAKHNVYVREQFRHHIKYTGDTSLVKKNVSKSGKRIEYIVDGVPIVCFEEGLTLDNGLITPIEERGNYTTFFLRPY